MNNTLARLYGNKLGQNILESIVRKCHRYLGIGTGDDVYFSGEKGVVEKMIRLYAAPFFIFDVGSHRGQYLDIVLSAVGQADCRIHCFEPSRRLSSALAERAGKDPRVVVNPLGLGEKTSQMELYFDSEDTGGFRDMNMGLYRITPSGYLHPLPDYQEIDEQFRTMNFAAICHQ